MQIFGWDLDSLKRFRFTHKYEKSSYFCWLYKNPIIGSMGRLYGIFTYMKYHQKINRIHVDRQNRPKNPHKNPSLGIFPRDIPIGKNPKTHQPLGVFSPGGYILSNPPHVRGTQAPSLLSNWLGHWHPTPGGVESRKNELLVGNQLEMLTSWKLNRNSLRIKYIYIYVWHTYIYI